jgi:uncharacterized protein YwqG
MIDAGAIYDNPAALAAACVLTVLAILAGVLAWRVMRKMRAAEVTAVEISADPDPTSAAIAIAEPPRIIEPLPLAAGRGSSLQVRHIFPPQPPLTRMSFLGGAPIAPHDFVWPIAANDDGLRRPLDFMGQIDCARLPDGELRPYLPADGYLFFFAPLEDAVSRADCAVCVHWASGDSADFVAHRPPTKPIDALRQWRYDWVAASAGKRAFIRDRTSRIEIECGWTPSFRPIEVEREFESDDLDFERWRKRRNDVLSDFHGKPQPADDFLSAHGLRGERAFEPFDGFPFCWMAIEIVTAQFLQHFEATPCADDHAVVGAQSLQSAAGRHDPLEEPSSDDKSAFLRWLRHIAESPILNLSIDRPGAKALAREIPAWISMATILSCEAMLADRVAYSRVPTRVIEALRHRHAALRSPAFESGAARQHQMFGHPRLTFGQSEEMSHTHHLLMQFDADEALGWNFGDGAYQYWITPADLAARKFSAVVLSFEGT